MSENSIILSIIIPVYNVKDYIKECVAGFSLCDFNDFEIILIDDGSSDGSEKICDSICENDNRIRVFHIKNSGPGNARNLGIKKAAGKYLFFCDSDDFVDTEAFKETMEILRNNPKDLFVFNRLYESPEAYWVDTIGLQKDNLSSVIDFTLHFRLSGPPKKIFCRKIVTEHNIEFPTDRTLYEDLSFFLKYLEYTDSVCTLEKPMYYHRYISGSLSSRFSFSQFNDLRLIYDEICRFVRNKNLDPRVINSVKNHLLAILMNIIARMKKAGISNREIIDRLIKCDMDCLVKDFSPTGLKSFIRIVFYRTRLFNIYALLYR